MLTQRVIPCLDVRDGRVVKGVRFRGLRDAGDPVECAARYEREGADELIILDVSATTEGRASAADTVAAVRESIAIPLTVGGGVGSLTDAERLLSVGADRVSLNTRAVEQPELIARLAQRTGVQCVVVAIDAAARENAHRERSAWEVTTRSGTRRTGEDAVAWARECERLGAGEILLTSWDRDGSRSGYDLALIDAVTRAVQIPVIASGGAASATHMREAFDAGAAATLAASIFHDRETTVADVKRELAAMGVAVRPLAPKPEEEERATG
jgi:imidazoleglycerol phosphate synthase cyclase subunit